MTQPRSHRLRTRRSRRIRPPQTAQDGRVSTGEAPMTLPDPHRRPPRAACQTIRRPPRGGDPQGVNQPSRRPLRGLRSRVIENPGMGDRIQRNTQIGDTRPGRREEPPAMLEPLAPRPTLRDAGAAMPDPEVRERPVRRTFTAEYKLRIVEEANAAREPGAVVALLRREGLYSSHLVEWRRLYRLGGLHNLAHPRGRLPGNPLAVENERLRRRVARLESRLGQEMLGVLAGWMVATRESAA